MPRSKRRKRRLVQAHKQLENVRKQIENEEDEKENTKPTDSPIEPDELEPVRDVKQVPRDSYHQEESDDKTGTERSGSSGWLEYAWGGICSSISQVRVY